MKLTGAEILRRIKEGSIEIDPFDVKQLNPNSYNLRLGRHVKQYTVDSNLGGVLDSKKPNPFYTSSIPESGYTLYPNHLYLCSTIERVMQKDLVPGISGRSSTARLGIEVHRTAGFGDIGFDGTWTLEITVIHPVIVYPGQEIAQIYFEVPYGEITKEFTYHGKYQHQSDVTESFMYRD